MGLDCDILVANAAELYPQIARKSGKIKESIASGCTRSVPLLLTIIERLFEDVLPELQRADAFASRAKVKDAIPIVQNGDEGAGNEGAERSNDNSLEEALGKIARVSFLGSQ